MRFSAILGIEQEDTFPIFSNHTDMVKFAKAEGVMEFDTVVRCMKEWLGM